MTEEKMLATGEARCLECEEIIVTVYVPTRGDAGSVVYVAVSPDATGSYGDLAADADVYCWRCAGAGN
jgi:hypothetical protein